MMYCDRCNAEFPAGMIYCKWCGQVLEERRPVTAAVQKCYSCSTPIQPGWTFCNSCGSKLTPDSQTPSQALCLRCGAVVPPGATNCVRCGERFAGDRGSVQVSRPSNATIAIQRCVACNEILEDGRAYCKACGTPVYQSSGADDSSYQTQVNPTPAPPAPQPTPPAVPPVNLQDPFYLLPTEPIQKTPAPQSAPPAADWQTNVPQNQGVSQTEVYQSLKPEASPDEPNSTVAFKSDPSTSPVEAQGTQNDLSSVLGQTIEYSVFNPPPVAEQSPDKAKSEYEADTVPVLSVDDLQAEPDVFDLFSTTQEATHQFPLNIEEEIAAGGKDIEFRFDITPIEETPSSGQPSSSEVAVDRQADHPARPSGTQHLQFDQLPFESTVQENTGALKKGRSTAKLSPPETVQAFPEEVSDWQTSATPSESLPPAAEVERNPFEAGLPPPEMPPTPVVEPLSPQQTQINQAQETQQVFAQPASPPVAPLPEHQAAPPWPENPQVVVAQPAKKKSGSPIALIAVGVLLLAAAGFAAWWFVLRAPVTPPNANSNTSTANANTGTANSNTSTTSAPATPEGMVVVAAGEYTIGRDDGDDVEKPKHAVTLKAFFMDKTEVTNAEYKKFVEATNHAAPPHWKNGAFAEGQANFPVVQVSWQDANDYAKWAGKRLPTEAEWEAAARGVEGRRYPWGNEWKDGFANIEAGSLQEVGRFASGASPDGALDLIGNVWEWTADAFALYPGSTGKMPEGIDPAQSYRVIRGGAYDVQRKKVNLDSSYRGFIEENRKDLTKTGFRCVKDANQ
jgi:iron(II)-dependent oxidoreductase